MPSGPSAQPSCSTHRSVHHQPLQLNHMKVAAVVQLFVVWLLYSISPCWHREPDLLVRCSDAPRPTKCRFGSSLHAFCWHSTVFTFPRCCELPVSVQHYESFLLCIALCFPSLSRMAWNNESTIFRLLMSIGSFRCLAVLLSLTSDYLFCPVCTCASPNSNDCCRSGLAWVCRDVIDVVWYACLSALTVVLRSLST